MKFVWYIEANYIKWRWIKKWYSNQLLQFITKGMHYPKDIIDTTLFYTQKYR